MTDSKKSNKFRKSPGNSINAARVTSYSDSLKSSIRSSAGKEHFDRILSAANKHLNKSEMAQLADSVTGRTGKYKTKNAALTQIGSYRYGKASFAARKKQLDDFFSSDRPKPPSPNKTAPSAPSQPRPASRLTALKTASKGLQRFVQRGASTARTGLSSTSFATKAAIALTASQAASTYSAARSKGHSKGKAAKIAAIEAAPAALAMTAPIWGRELREVGKVGFYATGEMIKFLGSPAGLMITGTSGGTAAIPALAMGVGSGASAVLGQLGKGLSKVGALPIAAGMAALDAAGGYRRDGVAGAVSAGADSLTFGVPSMADNALRKSGNGGVAQTITTIARQGVKALINAASGSSSGRAYLNDKAKQQAAALAPPTITIDRRKGTTEVGSDGRTAGYTAVRNGRSVHVKGYRTPKRAA